MSFDTNFLRELLIYNTTRTFVFLEEIIIREEQNEDERQAQGEKKITLFKPFSIWRFSKGNTP
jgi:hypothetical protein